MKTFAVAACIGAAFVAVAFACTVPAIDDTCQGTQTCSAPDGGNGSETGSPGGDSAAPDGGAQSDGGCPSSPASPLPAACVADDEAIFVSPMGNDGAAGTMEAPVRTIGHAILLAEVTSTHRVIACGGSYAEALSLSATAGDDVGLSIFGGADCSATPWTYPGSPIAQVKSPGPGLALQATGLTQAFVAADIEFDGPMAAGTGASSIGAFLGNVTAASFTNVTFTAKDGTGGASGSTGDNYADGGAVEGNAASDDGGIPRPGAAVTCTCADGSRTTGGGGGAADAEAGAGLPPWGAGGAGVNGAPCPAPAYSAGNDSPPNTSDAGAQSIGAVSAAGWTAGDGADGGNGAPGQGGGGGGDGQNDGAGSGGSCGGCGGAGGSGGQAGGSSIAMALYQSGVTLSQCTLIVGNAGAGGAGGSGQAGQAGAPSPSGGVTKGCAGGAGGAGAGGNGGNGGNGGISAGVAYSGQAPTVNGKATTSASVLMSVTLGSAGSAGTGGDGGIAAAGSANAGTAGQAGAAGSAQAVIEVP